MRRYAFIYNSRSGTGHRAGLLRMAADRLRAGNNEVMEYVCDGDPAASVPVALRDECEVIVACGGDGTVSTVAHALWAGGNQKAVLGVLPLGTLNHFARDLGISGTAEAEQVLVTGRVREVDAGSVNGRLFLDNSGIGIYPAMVLERERVRRAGVPRWPAFLLACIKTVSKLPFQRLHLEADGVRLARSTPFLFVGNNAYTVEGRSLGRRKRLDEGVLSIYVSRRVGPIGLFRFAVRALMGTLSQDKDFTALSAVKLTVRRKRNRALHVSLDGEVYRMRLPLEYSIVPQSVRVLCP